MMNSTVETRSISTQTSKDDYYTDKQDNKEESNYNKIYMEIYNSIKLEF